MQKQIQVMINGIPGNVSRMITTDILKNESFSLLPYSLTGPEIDINKFLIDNHSIELIPPSRRDKCITAIKESFGAFICLDFTHPSAVNQNAKFYCTHDLPFVMGTTGGDRQELYDTVKKSSVSAVIAPNMAKQIVGLQAMLEYGANNFPKLFDGYQLEVKESHQQGKTDTSGTAKAFAAYFNAMGVDFTMDQILAERDPEIQKTQWGVPEDYLNGHGWHIYELTSPDGTAKFEIRHNINGRNIYIEGILDAVRFLYKMLETCKRGKVFSMIDVMKNLNV